MANPGARACTRTHHLRCSAESAASWKVPRLSANNAGSCRGRNAAGSTPNDAPLALGPPCRSPTAPPAAKSTDDAFCLRACSCDSQVVQPQTKSTFSEKSKRGKPSHVLLAWALAWVMPRVNWPRRSYTRSAPDPPGRTFVGGLRFVPLRPLPSSISRRALGFVALGGGGRPVGLALVAIS